MDQNHLKHYWETRFIDYFVHSATDHNDASHDLGHFHRVYQTALNIAERENVSVDPLVLMAAAYLHDIVNLPKNHPESHMSSQYSAIKAKEILSSMHYPEEKIDSVCHAITTHSYTAQLQPETIEAKIIQDADRMEALGALGIMRTFYVSGRLERAPYDPADLFAKNRPLDDKVFGFDHFYCKLFKLPAMLQTEGGRQIAEKRTAFLHYFEHELEHDLLQENGGALKTVWACYHAGRHHLKLFDVINPWAIGRPLDVHHFVVDQLIAAQPLFPKFITHFLDQLKEEI